MPSPVAHSLAGVALARFRPDTLPLSFSWRGILLTVVAANLPDIDFAFEALSRVFPSVVQASHREWTHSIGAALVFTLAVFLIAVLWGANRPAMWALFLGSAYASHLILDIFTYTPRDPGGVPLFWPISDALIMAEQTIFMRIRWSEPDMWFSFYHAGALLWEAALMLPVVLLAWRRFLTRTNLRNAFARVRERRTTAPRARTIE